MPHEIATFVRRESVDRARDTGANVVKGPWPRRPQPRFEFGKHLLDRIQVRTVRREKSQLRTSRFDRRAHRGLFVDGEVVEDHDGADRKRGHQDLFDVGEEGRIIERPIKDRRRDQAGRRQRCDHRVDLPLAARREIAEPLAPRAATVASQQVRRDPAFIKKNIRARIVPRLSRVPRAARGRNLRAVLLDGVDRFF